MLLTELILSKRGPLAKVWLSAHQERKLSKQQALGVDVEESVEAILDQDDGPVALRLSGQLMLGVTRIYSRKVQYLLDDCKETRERISTAFRPGIVDLPEDQIRVNKNAITFSDAPNDFNFIDWSWTAPPPDLVSSHAASSQQTLLHHIRPSTREFGAYNFGRPSAPSLYGRSSASRSGSHDTSSHLDSQDFSGIDLGLTLDFDTSIEYGRDAASNLSRAGSVGIGKRHGSQDVVQGDMDMDFDNVDLGLDFHADLPELETRSQRASSALSTPLPVSPSRPIAEIDITPRTAARIQRFDGSAKAKRPRLLQADGELELGDDEFVAPGEDSALLGPERFIPSDPELVQLQSIATDPAAHFLPVIKVVGGTDMIYAGPEGLNPELAELFTFPTNILRRHRDDDAGRSPKRTRVQTSEDVEIGRRMSTAFQHDDVFAADQTFDSVVPGDDFFQPDVGGMPGISTPLRRRKEGSAAPSLAPSRAESIARAIQFGDQGDHPLAMYDSRRGGESQSQSLYDTPSKQSTTTTDDRRGYSRNTGMAMGLLRKELEEIDAELSFKETAAKATKKAASAFFFELLVLGTRDCVRLEQDRAFGDIAVRAKPRLFQEMTA